MAALMALTVASAGCGGKKLLARSLPDETQVIDGPTLALPPHFELRPPREAQDYEAVLRAQKTEEAHSLITGVSGSVPAAGGDVPQSDSWLLQQSSEQSGVRADPNVRGELEKQAAQPEEAKKPGLMKRWFGKNGSDE